MLTSASNDNIVIETLGISTKSSSYRDLLYKFGDYLKALLSIDEIIVKEYSPSSVIVAAEEVVLNTGKPYVDNELSDYSAFPELIKYYNNGFRSCAIIPMSKDGRHFGTITLLSKTNEGFGEDKINMLSIASAVTCSELGSKYERDKSLNIARYFDASFNNRLPQLLIDSEGRIAKANKPALNLFDISQKDILGSNISEIFEISEANFAKLKKGMSIELKAHGSDRIFELSPSKINDNLLHLLANDISATKEAWSKLQFLDNTDSETFLILDDDTNILWSSRSSLELFGIRNDILVGKKLSDFIVEPLNAKNLLKATAEQKHYNKLKFDFGGGAEFSGKMLSYKSGNQIYCIASKDYESFVGSAETITEDVLSLSNEPIIEADGSGYIISYNTAAGSLFKLERGIVGMSIYSICADSESQNKLSASLSIAKTNGYISDVYVNLVDYKTHGSMHCVQTIKSIKDEKGKVIKFIIMNKELATKEKLELLNEELDKAIRDVEKLRTESDLKSQFIYNISHDLKTPITNIMGFSKIILTDYSSNLTKEQIDYIQIIHDESERFLLLVKQILDVAKLSSGIVKLDFQRVNFNEIKENPSIKSLEEACKNKNLEFLWIVDYDVPEITADPNRLIQVFSNLIGNSLKFTETGSIKIHIMKKTGGSRGVRIEVSDTGIGIAKEDKPKIFKKFYQLRRGLVKQEGSGTGLGLSIAKEIVNLHGGRINVDSELGKGCVFWFTLPINPKVRDRTLKYNKSEHQGI